MNCERFTQDWTEWNADRLPVPDSGRMRRHLSQCPQCQAYHRQMQAMLQGLSDLSSSLSAETQSTEFGDRLLERGRSARRPDTPGRPGRYAIAASLLAGFIGGAVFWSQMDSRLSTPMAANGINGTESARMDGHSQSVSLSLQTVKTVRLAVDAERAVEHVIFTIEVPEGVEIAGYPGQRRLSWEGRLQAGRNGLSLPLVARHTGEGGLVKARIQYDGQQRELVLPVKLPDSAGRQIRRPVIDAV